jgi:hypothetical protein
VDALEQLAQAGVGTAGAGVEHEPDTAGFPGLAGDPDIADPRHQVDRLEDARKRQPELDRGADRSVPLGDHKYRRRREVEAVRDHVSVGRTNLGAHNESVVFGIRHGVSSSTHAVAAASYLTTRRL